MASSNRSVARPVTSLVPTVYPAPPEELQAACNLCGVVVTMFAFGARLDYHFGKNHQFYDWAYVRADQPEEWYAALRVLLQEGRHAFAHDIFPLGVGEYVK